MPELPDLEAFSTNLTKMLKGKKVDAIKVKVAKKLNVTAAKLNKQLKGQSITKVYRSGKELHVQFSGGDLLGLHLMLHGGLSFFEGPDTSKHAIISILFDDDTGLSVTDWQKAAVPTLNPKENEVPDALSKDMTADFLAEKMQTKKQIKKLLTDQKIIRGIGNAYADEILWDARISPFSISNKIPVAKIKVLVKSIQKVLKDAEKKILEAKPGIISGEVRNFLLIHNASKKESPKGAAIQHTEGAGKTYYTDEQILFS